MGADIEMTHTSPLRDKHRVAGTLGLGGLCLALGAASTSTDGLIAIGALLGVISLASAILWFNRDPVGAFLGMWLFEVAQAPLSALVGYRSSTGATVRQSSDVVTLLILALAIQRSWGKQPRTSMLRFMLPGAALVAIGLMSSITAHSSLTVALQGMWLGAKFWTLLAVSLLLPWRPSDAARIYRTLMSAGAVVAMLGLLDYFGHGLVATALHTNAASNAIGAYRANAVQSILSFPGEFSLFMSLVTAVAAARYMSSRHRVDLALFLLFTVSVFLSLRLKGVLSVGAVMVVVGLCRGRAGRSNLVPALLLGLLLGLFALAIEGSVISRQVTTYSASNGTTARAALYRVGTQIATAEFPLGAGFGRFASDTSRTHYSPLYDEYGLSNIYGLDRTYPNYIDDTSWPSVMGETGYAGLMLYAAGLLAIAFALYRRLRAATCELEWVPLAGLCVLAVMLVDSLGDPTFFEWRAVTAAAVVLGPGLTLIRATRRAVAPSGV